MKYQIDRELIAPVVNNPLGSIMVGGLLDQFLLYDPFKRACFGRTVSEIFQNVQKKNRRFLCE